MNRANCSADSSEPRAGVPRASAASVVNARQIGTRIAWTPILPVISSSGAGASRFAHICAKGPGGSVIYGRPCAFSGHSLDVTHAPLAYLRLQLSTPRKDRAHETRRSDHGVPRSLPLRTR